MASVVHEDAETQPEALVIPADPAFFHTTVCGTPLVLRAVYALGGVARTVHILRTAACPASAAHDLEAEIRERERRPRVRWTDSTDSVSTENGLFVVTQPAVFDSRLCAELSSEPCDDTAIVRCRRPDQRGSALWFAGKEVARPLARHLAAHPGEAMFPDSDLAPLVRDYNPDGAVCEIISDEGTRRLAEKRLLKGARKATDSLMARLDRNVSGWVTRHLARTSITPNQVTLLNSLLGLVGALLILPGTYWAQVSGAALLVLSVIIDGCDGELARIKFFETSLGRKLDFFLDNVVNTTAIFAAGAGYYFRFGESVYLGLALYSAVLAAVAVWPVYSLFFRHGQKAVSEGREPGGGTYSKVEALQGRDFVYLILGLALFGKTHWFSILSAVGLTIFVTVVLVLWWRRCDPRVTGA